MLKLDPRELWRVVDEPDISMCGFIPTTTMLIAAKQARRETRKADQARHERRHQRRLLACGRVRGDRGECCTDMKILFATAEVSPIAKTGGLGDVCGSLPKALAKLGHDVTVFMPYYRQAREWFANNGVDARRGAAARRMCRWANWAAEATYLRTTLPGTDIPLILVANDYFFHRPHIYSPRFDGYDDGIERFTFFCRAVVRGCELLGIAPDIVHAHDWHTALLPVYLHSGLRGSDAVPRRALGLHDPQPQLPGHRRAASASRALGLHSRYWAPDALEHFGDVNLMKGGIIFADQVTTVSPTYAREIQTHEHGAGLDGILRSLSFKLHGHPQRHRRRGVGSGDRSAPPLALFERERLAGKSLSKRALLRELKLTLQGEDAAAGVHLPARRSERNRSARSPRCRRCLPPARRR